MDIKVPDTKEEMLELHKRWDNCNIWLAQADYTKEQQTACWELMEALEEAMSTASSKFTFDENGNIV